MNKAVVPGPPYPGVYEHYKGGLYVVHKIITDETSLHTTNNLRGRIMVLYEQVGSAELYVRFIVDFLSYVHPDGEPSFMHHMNSEIEACKKCKPRFKLINPEE